MTDNRKRIGRPTNPPTPGKRVSLGLKVTADVKTRLDKSAVASGRTQSQEAEMRLDQSFQREDLLGDALKLAFGERFAGLALLLCKTMHFAGAKACWSGAFMQGRYYPPADWIDDAFGYDQAVKAAHAILEAARPSGDPTSPEWDDHDPNLTDELGR